MADVTDEWRPTELSAIALGCGLSYRDFTRLSVCFPLLYRYNGSARPRNQRFGAESSCYSPKTHHEWSIKRNPPRQWCESPIGLHGKYRLDVQSSSCLLISDTVNGATSERSRSMAKQAKLLSDAENRSSAMQQTAYHARTAVNLVLIAGCTRNGDELYVFRTCGSDEV